MRWLTLYLRSRRVPVALAAAVVGMVVMWVLGAIVNDGAPGVTMVVLTALLLVAALTATLGGPDEELDRTAAQPWAPRRVAHLLAALAVVAGLPLLTHLTGSSFGPTGLVIRDAAGLLGLTALSAPLLGAGRAWFVPLGWTLAAAVYPVTGHVLGEILTWQSQVPGNTPAAVTATVLGVGGLIAYALAGPARRAPAEAAL
ncbi:hypothetical protein GCM10027280_42220 [Micromonospora polyrhachis]|uniref:Uncharacterized protein n=1 Tax=Micromonospora polyrhachis TaxID=1282883 RepID=A0A7W7SLS7_9ACTN|nr:hypothetical protein [Micromonospora polyrhachis]MBB4957084.1 hypothetical protein [Micromonospora polyrhachis]